MHDLEIAAVVLAVTNNTFFAGYIGRGVVAIFVSNQLFDFLVAFEAFCIGDFLADFMAQGAIRQTFKLFMGRRQLSGRQLRITILKADGDQPEYEGFEFFVCHI